MAPEGLVAIKIFVEIFNDLILLNYGNEILPEQWSNLTSNQASFEQLDILSLGIRLFLKKILY